MRDDDAFARGGGIARGHVAMAVEEGDRLFFDDLGSVADACFEAFGGDETSVCLARKRKQIGIVIDD